MPNHEDPNQVSQPQPQPTAAELWAKGIQQSWMKPLGSYYSEPLLMNDNERPKLSEYAPEIQALFDNNNWSDIYNEANNRSMRMMIEAAGGNADTFFDQYESPTVMDAVKFSNFDGYNDKVEAYKEGISNQVGFNNAIEELNNEYKSRYSTSYLGKELASGIDGILPDWIRTDKERQADFEQALKYETGLGIDINDSGRVGDVASDSWLGWAWDGLANTVNDLAFLVTDETTALINTAYDFFSSEGIYGANLEFQEQIKNKEVPTFFEYDEMKRAGETGNFLTEFFNNPYGYAGLFSSDAREMYTQSYLSAPRVDNIQTFMDRNDNEFGDVWAIATDQLIQSAPLLLDIWGGAGIAKGALKKGLKKSAAKQVGQRTVKTRGGGTTTQYFDPKNPFKTLKKDYAQEILEKGSRLHRMTESTTGFVLSSSLVAAQMHADLVGDEWYDNLNSSERAWYLANQGSSEVLSGIILRNVMGGNTFLGRFGKSKITQNVIKNQRSAVLEWGKQAAKNFIFGIAEEAASEAATAGWQYINEINARINSGDETAYYSSDEFWKRVKEGAVAGAIIGMPAGMIGGVVKPGAEAFLANYAKDHLEGNKKISEKVARLDRAKTASERRAALQALEEEIANNSAVNASVARAYYRMSKSNPDLFSEVVGIQNQINVLVEKHKKSKSQEEKSEIRSKVKDLIQEKQALENQAFEGDTTFDDVVKEEYKKTLGKRRSKISEAQSMMESDPEVLADKALSQDLDEQIASLEAAVKANSKEQNADDDAQDQQGKPQGAKPKRDPNYKAKPGERITANPGEALPEAASNNPLYKTIRGTTNFFLKAFKKLGVGVVLHETEASYVAATGNTSKGTFTKGKVVHINMANPKTNSKTVRHEFYHAAYLTIDPKVREQRLNELKRLLYSVPGVGKNNVDRLLSNIEKTYDDYTEAQLIEEKFVTLLERYGDKIPLKEEGSLTRFGRELVNIFARLFGIPQIEAKIFAQEGELKQFVANFRASERTGREFTGEQLSEASDIESRDIGMSQPSRAYPDLINKKVSYRIYYLDRFEGQQSYQVDGIVFKDYWHFRNWYIRETGNGKRAKNFGNFSYVGNDGTIKKINPPKPKVDRETGEIIDMEPRFKTPAQKRIEANERSAEIGRRKSNFRDIRQRAGDALNFAVGNIRKIGRTGEKTFYGNGFFEKETKPELPITYSDTFFVNGLNYGQLQELGDDFGQDLEFAFPPRVPAEFEFTVTNNGDGTITIDVHSDTVPTANPVDLKPEQPTDGEVNMEQRDVEDRDESETNSLMDVIGRLIPVESLREVNGMQIVTVFYDPSTGGRSGIGADYERGYLFSQSDEEGANKTLGAIQRASIKDVEKRIREASKSGRGPRYVEGREENAETGEVTYKGKIILGTGLMRTSSLYGNSDFIGLVKDQYLLYFNRLSEALGASEANSMFVGGFVNFLKERLASNDAELDALVNISKVYGLLDDSKNFTRMSTGKGAADVGYIAVPKTAEGVFIMLEKIQKSQSEDFRNINRQFRSKASLIEAMISGDKSFSSRIIDGKVDESLLPTPYNAISEMRNRAMLSGDADALESLSQTLGYFKIFEYVLAEVDGIRGKEMRLKNVEVAKEDSEGREDLPFSWSVKVKNGAFEKDEHSYMSEEGGGILSEFVSKEKLELVDVMSKYAPSYGRMNTLMKKYGTKTIGDTSEAIEAKISELRRKESEWISDRDKFTPEVNEIAQEVGALDKIISNSKKSKQERAEAADKKKKFTNPKTKNPLYKKFQELYSINQEIEESKKDLQSQKQAERGMQNAAAPGEINVKEKLTEEATRDNRVVEQSEVDSTEDNAGMESREIESEDGTSQGWEPNNMNSFQAFMSRVDQLFANKYSNVFSLQRAIEGAQKAVVDLSQDFINAETLMYGKTSNDLDKLDDKVKAISQEMKSNGLTSEDVSEYLIARHAEERNALIAERTEGATIDGSGMSNERAQEVMDGFSKEKKAALESISRKVDDITSDTRRTMVELGLESQETIDAFEQMFDFYVPLGGLSVDEMSADTSLYPTGGAGMSIYGDTTRRARGRKSQANNVLAQAIAQNAAVHAKGRKNEALSSLYNLVKENPNPRVWKITDTIPFDAQGAVGVRVNGEQKFIVFTNADHAKSLKNMGVEKLDLVSKAMRRFSGFLRRSFTTANPEFIISNFARDIQSALFNAMAEADIPGGQIESKYIATKIIQRVKETLPALLKSAVGVDLTPEIAAYFEEFKEDGGQTGWGFVKDVGTIAAEIEAEVNEKSKARKASEWMQKHSIDVVENVNDAFENSIRLAAYIEAREAGASREKAAELAKNITVNFNRSGELGPVLNAWYMFFNASVQGTVRLARSLGTLKDVRKPNGELESWYNRLNSAQKMAFGLSLISGMLATINMGLSDEDEDGVLFYNKIPDYEKERNLIIMYDGKNYLKIPLPYGFNVFSNMGTAMAESAAGHREPEDAGMFLLNSAFSSFSPISFGQSKDAAKYIAKGVTPTILKPMVDIAVNESYFGSSVYKEQFPVGAPKPEAEMSFRSPEGVRKFFQWMNEATGGSEFVPGKMDFNPDKFWYGFEYYIGGAGQFVTRTVGTSRDLYETIKEGEKVQMKANDFPFLRKVYGEFSKYYDSDVYVENANLVSQLYKERKESENKSDSRYKGIVQLESSRKRTEKQIKKIRQLRKEARDIENYVERQNRIYELYEKERSILMQFNKEFENLRGKN